jgi:hypothetical protein
MAKMLVIWTRLSRRLARTRETRTLYAVDAKGGGRSSAMAGEMLATSALGQLRSSGSRKLKLRVAGSKC